MTWLIDVLVDLMPRRLRERVVERERMGGWLSGLAAEWSKEKRE